MVGEDDDVEGARRIVRRARDPVECLVEVPQDGQRIGPLDARVMSDLVVPRERRVHHRPARVDVADHGGHGEIALDDDHEGAK